MSLGNIITERINRAIAQSEWKEGERQRDTEKYMGGERGCRGRWGERENNKCGEGREGGRAVARKREGTGKNRKVSKSVSLEGE